MAELQFPNYLASMNAGYEQGNRIAEQNRALKQRNHLQQLAPQVIAGDPTAYDQAAAIDPDAATRYQQAGDASLVKMRNMVDYIDRARASGNQAAVSAALRVAGPYITKFTGKPAPTEWTPDMDAGWEALKAKVAMAGNPTPGGRVQSTYIDAQGNRVAIMADGSTQILGQNAPNNQIIDTGNGFYGVNKGNLQAAPVMVGGQPPSTAPQAPSGQVQTGEGSVFIDPSLPPNVRAAIAANPAQFAGAGPQTVQLPPVVEDGPPPALPTQGNLPPPLDYQNGGQLRSAPKPQAAPAGYRYAADGNLEMIPGGPAEVAAQARDAAQQAKDEAMRAKELQAQETQNARQAEAATSAQSLIDAIDTLTRSPGYNDLGTIGGDVAIHTPFIRSDAKDAHAQLQNVAGQVALATMSRLKALSKQGATGFGALSEKELALLQNSIATLASGDISHAQLAASLKTIRDSMEKVTKWRGQQPAPQSAAGWSIQKVN